MALPFILAGLAAVGAYKAFRSYDDDKHDDRDDAERRLREAEKEREERQRTQKREAAQENVQKEGRAYGENLARALPASLLEARSQDAFALHFNLNNPSLKSSLHLERRMKDAAQGVSKVFAAIPGLESIHQATQGAAQSFAALESTRNANQKDAQLSAAIAGLDSMLTARASRQTTIENLVTFAELYKLQFQCGAALDKTTKQIANIDKDIAALTEIEAQLVKLENEAAFTSTQKDTTS